MQNLIQKILQNYCVLSKADFWYAFLFLWLSHSINGQSNEVWSQNIEMQKDTLSGFVKIKQQIKLSKPTESDTLSFYGWANAFLSNEAALNKRMLENYKLDLHFTSKSKRGQIYIDSVFVNKNKITGYKYRDLHKDILQVPVNTRQDSLCIEFYYRLQLPKNKFTGYGIGKNGILLKDFYWVPLTDTLKSYHQLNLDDLPESKSLFRFKVKNFEKDQKIYTNFNSGDSLNKLQNHLEIYITQKALDTFSFSDKKLFIYPFYSKKVSAKQKQMLINKIMGYMEEILGSYPGKTIIITESDLKNHPLYGPDWLPDFINPFDTSLLWELKILHQISHKYAAEMQVDKRKNPWLYFAIASFAEYNYVKRFYKNLSLTGNLSHHKLFRYYYITQAPYAEKFPFLYLYMARINKDQALTTSLDSLSNFNKEAANPAKMALGMEMLKNERNEDDYYKQFKETYRLSLQDSLSPHVFSNLFGLSSEHWFHQYLQTRKKYDYSLKIIKKEKEKLYLKIKNKQKEKMPLQIFAVGKSGVQKIKNLPPISHDTIITVKRKPKWEYIGINYYNQYPEIQIRNNYVKIHSLFLHKPLQIRLFRDLENPLRNQIFINPYFQYNYYDGVILGTQIYNQGILHNHFSYALSPSFSTKAKKLSGSFSLSNTHYFDNLNPFSIKYGLAGSYYHYNFDLSYTKLNPFVAVEFHSPNLRDRNSSKLTLGYMYINKEMEGGIKTPDSYYKVADLNFHLKKINVILDRFFKADLQLASSFGKLSTSYRIRWLTNKTRQMDIRFFAGTFLYNHTGSDYFSFALDRPTDYLFQYNYYGRSETSGLFHQQFIWAEGGFKTFFDDQYANQWLVSNNINLGIWKWFNVYGDFAYKKNKYESPRFYCDSGLRINFVQDYFEIFFPMYSSKGFEPGQGDYLQKIRLVFTIDLPRLQKMFTRGWY